MRGINISIIKQRLTPEQIKILDEVLDRRENTLIAYKLLLKDYSNVKKRVRAIEKRLVTIMKELPEDDFIPRWIMSEVAAIENKYPAIDKAIRLYKQDMSYFNQCLGYPDPRTFNLHFVGTYPLQNLRSHLSGADVRIYEGMDAIRITERYFKKAASAFASYKSSKEWRRKHLPRPPVDVPRPVMYVVPDSPPQPEGGDTPPSSETDLPGQPDSALPE